MFALAALVLFTAVIVGKVAMVTGTLWLAAALTEMSFSLEQLGGAAVAIVGVHAALTFTIDIKLKPKGRW